jgi:hypothetical protein
MPCTEGLLKSQRVESPRQTVHHIPHRSEHPHATRPSLDVLAQRAERFELDAAILLRAPVYLLFVGGTLQVLIEAGEGGERAVAHKAFVRRPIERALCRPRCRARSFVPSRPTNQPVGVRYSTVSVRSHNAAIELFARHARRAGARLEAEHEGCNGDKRPNAAVCRAHDVARLV